MGYVPQAGSLYSEAIEGRHSDQAALGSCMTPSEIAQRLLFNTHWPNKISVGQSWTGMATQPLIKALGLTLAARSTYKAK